MLSLQYLKMTVVSDGHGLLPLKLEAIEDLSLHWNFPKSPSS